MLCLVSGANRGIGLELVRQLRARGDTVLAGCRQPDKAQKLVELAEADADGGIEVFPLDVLELSSCHAAAGRLAGRPLDLLINNAGVLPSDGRFGDLDYDALRLAFETNALGPLRLIEALVPALKASRIRKVIQMTSRMGSIEDNKSGGYYAYRASKAALNMINKSLSLDLGIHDIISVVMHPGWVQSDMGGRGANLDATTSVQGMLEVIDGLGLADSGKFYSWKGDEIPW
jgi:NAD(P)-dependent dehydrogenase (short-subunit alcohol dehydrogenase family)